MALDLRTDLFEACQHISPRHPDYASVPIEDGFDWSSLSCCPFERLYLVVFRSVWRPEADLDLLRELDDRAYEEAPRLRGSEKGRRSPPLLQGPRERARRMPIVLPLGDARAGHKGRRRPRAPLRYSRHRADVSLLCARTLLVEEGCREAYPRAHRERLEESRRPSPNRAFSHQQSAISHKKQKAKS